MATGRRIRGETTELTDTHRERERERESRKRAIERCSVLLT